MDVQTSAQKFRVDWKVGGAKGAIDPDEAVGADHRLPLFLREAGDHRTHVVGIAAAAARQRHRLEHANFLFLVEQPPRQLVERQPGNRKASDNLGWHDSCLDQPRGT